MNQNEEQVHVANTNSYGGERNFFFSAFLPSGNYILVLCFHFVICIVYRFVDFYLFWISSYMYYSLPLYICGHRKFCPLILLVLGIIYLFIYTYILMSLPLKVGLFSNLAELWVLLGYSIYIVGIIGERWGL